MVLGLFDASALLVDKPPLHFQFMHKVLDALAHHGGRRFVQLPVGSGGEQVADVTDRIARSVRQMLALVDSLRQRTRCRSLSLKGQLLLAFFQPSSFGPRLPLEGPTLLLGKPPMAS